MDDFDFVAFGKGVRFYRNKLGLTEEMLAERIKSNQNYISDIERGKAHPSVEKVVAICNALNVSVSACMKREKGEHCTMYHQFKHQLLVLSDDSKKSLIKVLALLNEIEG